MSQIKSNEAVDAAINGRTHVAELRRTLLSKLAEQGTVVRSRDDEFNLHLVRQPQTPEASLPANGFRYEKELTFDPESGRRNLMLRANSMADLTALENQILG